jgi:hypothetical protein
MSFYTGCVWLVHYHNVINTEVLLSIATFSFSSNVCKTVREVLSDAIFPLRDHIAIVEQIERDLRVFVAKVKMIRRHVLGVH